MISPPEPPPLDRSGRDLLFAAIGIVAVVLGIVLADLAFDDTAPPGEGLVPVVAEEPGGPPGGAVVPINRPDPLPVFEDAVVVVPGGTDGVPVPPPGAQDGGDGPGAPQGTPPAEAPPGPQTPGVRWLDECATAVGPLCPPGLAGTILGEPLLRITVLPEATRARIPALRCDPGYSTEDTIPVVVLSSLPAFFEVEILTADGVLVGSATQRSPDTELDLWEDRAAGDIGAVSPTVEGGVHACLAVSLDRSQMDDRNGSFLARVTATGPPWKTTVEVPFVGQFDAVRPPIWLIGRNETQAYLSVPEIEGETTRVWVYETTQQAGVEHCAAEGPQTGGEVSRHWAEPKPIDQGLLPPEHSDYEFYTLWDLHLLPGSRYTLCIEWAKEGVVEEWSLLTPDGYRLTIVSGILAVGLDSKVTQGALEVPIWGVGGCTNADFSWAMFPHRDVLEPGGYLGVNGNVICSSGGPFNDYIQIEARFAATNDLAGVLRIPSQALFENCTGLLDADDGIYGEPFRGDWWGWIGGLCETSLEWSPDVVCGQGGWGDFLPDYRPEPSPPICDYIPYYTLGLGFHVDRWDANHRPEPDDWGYELVERRSF